MPRGKGIYDDEDADEAKGVEPTDQGREEGHSRRRRNRPGADRVVGHLAFLPSRLRRRRRAKTAEPVRNQLDIWVGVQGGIERDARNAAAQNRYHGFNNGDTGH